MKAIVYHNYGSPDALQCEEIEMPTVGDDEVLTKVRAASVNPLDWHFPPVSGLSCPPCFVADVLTLRKELAIDLDLGLVHLLGGSL